MRLAALRRCPVPRSEGRADLLLDPFRGSVSAKTNWEAFLRCGKLSQCNPSALKRDMHLHDRASYLLAHVVPDVPSHRLTPMSLFLDMISMSLCWTPTR